MQIFRAGQTPSRPGPAEWFTGRVRIDALFNAADPDRVQGAHVSRHKTRQDLALEYGATDIVSERGDDGVARIRELTGNVGADSVLECVGTNESMHQPIDCARPGGSVDRGDRRRAEVGAAPVRAAQYVRMSTEHRQYSTENQARVIRQYADQQVSRSSGPMPMKAAAGCGSKDATRFRG